MKKFLFIPVILLLFSCQEEEYQPALQIEDKVEQFYKLVRINTKTDLGFETAVANRLDSKISYECSAGEVVESNSSMLFLAPDKPCKVKIKRKIELDDETSQTSEYTILVYKQFVILKADDLMYEPGDIISDRWTNYFNYIENKGLKSSVGIVGVSLKQGNAEYLKRVKHLHELPNFEIWNHGYLHLVNAKDEEGNLYSEYRDTPYEYQKEMLEQSQEMARERLGFKMRTFGAPGNAIDANTTRVINEDDEILVWFYGNENSSKFLIPRAHEIEYPFGVPDYGKFIKEYNSGEKFYSLQVHPNMWNPEQFKEFKKIVDFLISNDVIFINPYEYYKYFNKII